MSYDAKAGEGNPHCFRIVPNGANEKQYSPGNNYVGIDAVTWFVNGKSNFFTERMVAGTVEITINGETFPVVLGQFELKEGQQIAPIFDRSLIGSMPYNSGNFVIKLVISGTKHNTAAGTLLKQMAAATLTAVAGTVTLETAGAGGVALVAAGGVLVKGAQEVLNDNSDKKVPIFNPYEVTLHPVPDLRGDKSYIIVHRGTDGLLDAKFSVSTGTGGMDVKYDGQPFRDGAWLLLCIRRSDTYPGDPRPWDKEYKNTRSSFDELMDSWRSGQTTKEEVKKNLKRSDNESPTLSDQVAQVRKRIRYDEALILTDRGKYAGVLSAYLKAANDAITANNPQKYFDEIAKIRSATSSKGPISPLLQRSIVKEFLTYSDKFPSYTTSDAKKLSFADNAVN